MLQLKNIVKDYYVGTQTVHALRGVSLNFRKSEFVSVLGPSGCGKTTLMNIIGGLDKYTSGELNIDGISTSDFQDKDWDNYRNKRIGFVFQSYNLIPHLNVFGNVEIALTISGMSKDERKKRVMSALEEVGLTDQYHQRPNQLSGGQMQRVAIARALVNSPEILLADEPTGALDTETSGQIMELINEISKDRLVIMVTHNPKIAKRFSTRIINMLDGVITDDSMPYEPEAKDIKDKIEPAGTSPRPKREKKSSMSYLTALSLSWKNLITKKGRTILTSIAGSIGIVGIALILAMSGGMNNYIDKLQSDTLASNPITISSSTIDFTQAMNAMNDREILERFPSAKEIYVEKAITAADMMTKNNITDEYISYIESSLDRAWYNDIIYKTGLGLNIYGIKEGETAYSNLTKTQASSSGGGGMDFGFGGSRSYWNMMLESGFVQSQYDILDGKYPENMNEIVIIVGDTNQIGEETLIALGIKSAEDEVVKYGFDEVLGRTYKLVHNDLMYQKVESGYIEKPPLDIDYDAAQTLTVVGILRVKEDTEGGVLSRGIGYTKDMYYWLLDANYDSEIIAFMNENPTINHPFTKDYSPTSPPIQKTKEELREEVYRMLGGTKLPNEISIYPVSFDTKTWIKDTLNDYNIGREQDDMVTYLDMSEILGTALSSIVNTISYVLIAFTAISLIVSSIMIAIITYVSVLERTKEIGVLRSIGARKKDVTRVFNAETIIIGLIAGIIGVGMTYLLSIPINIIINSLIEVQGIASLKIVYALSLIIISIVLTLISGLVPARKAATLDPVAALRTE